MSANPSIGCAADGVAVTPHDSVELPQLCRAFYIGGAGNLTVETYAGTTLQFANCPAGAIIPVQAVKVMATGTTATQITGLY